ncbi:alkaline phosphatase family protein [Flavobacteriales bacterium]|nr:alkaline phosphatase family protein [Flavobacteriales bacterium]MDB2675463.1 alkaline phosphatase family protein [Flavobacteriales bacterium]
MKKIIIIALILCSGIAQAQEKPKLVVGIVVDQMRYDYIYRFWNQFQDDGFKKLVNEGYFLRNTHYNYTPTYTGPGHASIFTGTTPSVHGIIGNNWYNKSDGSSVYCAGDGNTTTVCDCDNHKDVEASAGKMSPHRMLTTTFSDELKLFSPNSKVFGISIKDRGAILPAGHTANGAFWMGKSGEWISSSYYYEQLPEWLVEFQQDKPASSYFKGAWKGKGFGYPMDSLLSSRGPSSVKSTPQGNTYLKDLAIALMKSEKMGDDKITDVLTISFSSTDYIGHQFGPHAQELVDTYIKLDKEIAEILKHINSTVGKENALVFLTSDHGVVSVPNELKKRKIPAGYFDASNLTTELNSHLSKRFGENNWVLKYSNQQFFLNRNLIDDQKLNHQEVQQVAADYLIKTEGVQNVFTAHQLHHNEYQNSFHSLIQKGFNQKRSGDVVIALNSGWIEWSSPTGTTHGSCFSYDTHVPLLFWGKGIKQGLSDEYVSICDIAPTVSTLLGISFPNGCTGKPIRSITE